MQTQHARPLALLVHAFCVLCLMGCSKNASKTTMDAGTVHKDAGQAHDAGRLTDAGHASDAGHDAATVVKCGGSLCTPSFGKACCTATGTGTAANALELVGRGPNLCGVDLGQFAASIAGICLQLNQPGTLDSHCPDVPSTTPGQPDLKGCCSDQGFCGGLETGLALGCAYLGNTRGQACGANVDAGTERDGGH